MSNKDLTNSKEWKILSAHRREIDNIQIKALFAEDPNRFKNFHIEYEGLLFDYSKHRATAETIKHLCTLARARGLEQQRNKMCAGEHINCTEDRAVLHMALRGSTANNLKIDGENVANFVNKTLAQIESLSQKIRSNLDITDVINIGIGGSDLGPRMVCRAMRPFANGPTVHFVSNIDGCALDEILAQCTPRKTIILMASKSFTTLEMLTNAQSAKAWLLSALSPDEISERLFAITTNNKPARAFGVPDEHILPLRDWVGGRFSVWGAVGFPIAIACGFPVFQDFLAGAYKADQHFMTAPLEKNIPVLMGLLGLWYRNFWDMHAQAILPYAHDLRNFPSYLQQLEMESNGKSIDKSGLPVQSRTGAILFGESGTDAQHAFMQLLHQGTEITPVEFITFSEGQHNFSGHHDHLFSHALAQSKALMDGADNKEPYRHFSGNRPSSTFLLKRLDAQHLGMLMALYEHKVFVQGVLWDINSFDQWGVELGKIIAKDIHATMENAKQTSGFDGSTNGLLYFFRDKTKPNC